MPTRSTPPSFTGAGLPLAFPCALLWSALALSLGGCSSPPSSASASATSTSTSTSAATTTPETTAATSTTADTETGAGTSTTGEVHESAQIVHSFGSINLAAYKERFRCATWTVGNEEALYVDTVHLSNDGGFHHSNWFIVPDDLFPGDDGFFNCSDRGYTETIGVISGSVLFAQSTQSRYEAQALAEGAVVKIPPRSKVIAEMHLLNPGSEKLVSELRMGFDIVHPADVDVVVSPFRLNYVDLQIPADKHSRNQAECLFRSPYEDYTGHSFDLKLYYGLPHYHYLGEHFFVDIAGGPRDGERIFELDGFNGDGNGQVYDPPLDMSDADGFRFGCGYNNWTDSDVSYGVGDQEMCTFLGFADARAILDGGVDGGTMAVEADGETIVMEGPCGVLTVPKTAAYSKPNAEEKEGPLYVPPPGPGDSDLPPVKPCADIAPAATPTIEPTLSALKTALLIPSCSFNACHALGPNGAAAGLDLQAVDLRSTLLNHEVYADSGMPLVSPGDPAESWLYRVVSECSPLDAQGNVASHMPLNAPTLPDEGLVAALREWIEDGALDN